MQCPVCSNTALVMSERQGIEIDYCPQCRGVWLDRGELDKIIERATPAAAAPPAPPGFGNRPAQPAPPPYPQSQGDPYRQPPPQQPYQQPYPQQGHYRDDYHKRKKKGFLGELFDFD